MWSSPEQLRKIAPYLNLGTVLVACVLLGVAVGYWLDGKLQTSPWLLLAGALLGVFSGFYHFIKTVIQMQDAEKKARQKEHGQE